MVARSHMRKGIGNYPDETHLFIVELGFWEVNIGPFDGSSLYLNAMHREWNLPRRERDMKIGILFTALFTVGSHALLGQILVDDLSELKG